MPPAASQLDAGVQMPASGAAGISQPTAAGKTTRGGAGALAAVSGRGGSTGDRLDAGPALQPDARACMIPNEIPILESDADGGLPSCQNDPLKVIAENCIGGFCHDSNGPLGGGLDLMAPCVADRLVNVKSRCQDLLLLDTARPERSFLVDKLIGEKPKRGTSMPFEGHLPHDEMVCMNAWISAVLRTATQN